MRSRYARPDKKYELYTGRNTIIERLKKMRALNCDPSDVGMDGYLFLLKRVPFNKPNTFTKL